MNFQGYVLIIFEKSLRNLMGGGRPMKIKHCLNDIPCVTSIIFKVLQALQRAKLYINQFLASVAEIIN